MSSFRRSSSAQACLAAYRLGCRHSRAGDLRETAIELIRVLAYPKFRLTEPDRAALLADYLPYAEVVLLPNRLPVLPVACRDRDDVVFLQLALAARRAGRERRR